MIDRAVKILRAGGLVAFPTETVYGLGADARSDSAVRRIFAAKGRPPTNPLIAHVADVASARRYASDWPDVAEVLAQKFWPGPLTLVVRKAANIVAAATSGQKTVGLRVPAHSIALELLQRFDGPIAAPSANRSNRISPTTVEHVREELGDSVDLILDGGPCVVGIESTVLDVVGTVPAILRPGGITREHIEAVVGPIDVREMRRDSSTVASSPGQQVTHYSPLTPAWYFASDEAIPSDESVVVILVWATPASPANVPLPSTGDAGIAPTKRIDLSDDPARYAHDLYDALRRADAMKRHRIFIELPPPLPEWIAVRDRIMRAAKPWRGVHG